MDTRPTFIKMLWRGVRRRCAWCNGRGAFFTGWFRKQEHCRTCGIGWHRGYEGFELGALVASLTMVFGLLVVVLTTGIVMTSPDVAVGPLVIAGAAIAVVVPIVTYPISYTIWQAIDLVTHPPEPGDGSPPPVL